MSKNKTTVLLVALAVLLIAGLYSASGMARMLTIPDPPAIDAYALMQDQNAYDPSKADGVAGIIVMEDLQKANSVNSVTAVVFDFRGYDTLGESFVLFTAITGTMVVIRGMKKREIEEVHENV